MKRQQHYIYNVHLREQFKFIKQSKHKINIQPPFGVPILISDSGFVFMEELFMDSTRFALFNELDSVF